MAKYCKVQAHGETIYVQYSDNSFIYVACSDDDKQYIINHIHSIQPDLEMIHETSTYDEFMTHFYKAMKSILSTYSAAT